MIGVFPRRAQSTDAKLWFLEWARRPSGGVSQAGSANRRWAGNPRILPYGFRGDQRSALHGIGARFYRVHALVHQEHHAHIRADVPADEFFISIFPFLASIPKETG